MPPFRTRRPARPTSRPRAAIAAGLLAGCLLAACGETDSGAAPGDAVDSPGEATEASGTPEETAVSVFYVEAGPRGPYLVPEQHVVDAAEPLTAAADLLTQPADDPDYDTLLPSGSIESVEVNEADGTIDVRLPDDGWRAPVEQSPREARLAVQQLVYTVQGAAGTSSPVRVLVGDAPGPLFGVDTGDGVQAADPLLTQKLVSVAEPAEGATVSGTFTARGEASSFEATVPWQVRRGEEVVLDGFTTAEGWIDDLYPWEAQVDVSGLEPGEYTFVAMTDDPTGGTEGPGPAEDTKTIVVE